MEVWDRDRVMKFLDLYEQEPVIWNRKHPYYNDRCHVHEAWRRIQGRISFDCSVKELKLKKHKLLRGFGKVALKIKRSEETGVPYKPRWFAFERMASFLYPFYRPRKSKPVDCEPKEITITESSGTVAKEVQKKDHLPIEPTVEIKEEPSDYASNPSTSSNNTNDEFILPHDESSWTASDSAVEPQFTLSVANLSSPNGPETTDGEQPNKKRRPISNRITSTSTYVPPVTNGPGRIPQSPLYNFDEFPTPSGFSNEPRGEYPMSSTLSKASRGEYPTPSTLSKEPRGEFSAPVPASKESHKDQFDVFGEYIAAKLRSLDRRSCAFAQKAIGDIIFDAEMGKYLTEGHN